MGRVATGKSSVAAQLASELDWPVFSSDQIRKSVAGLAFTERTPTELRAQLYSEEAKREIYAKLIHDGLAAGAQFGGAVIDATFSRRADRHYLREEARRVGLGLQLIELDAPNKQLLARLRARAVATSTNSDAREEDFDKLNALYESPGTDEYVIEMQASGAVADTSQAVMRALATRQADRHGFGT
jgi:predicted kinase